eukprot:12260689-Ditylum_brightwellii.AAC.1
MFAQEEQRDTSPFASALYTFLIVVPMPLVFGAFGKRNRELHEFLESASLGDVSTKDDLSMSPVQSMYDRNGAYPLLLYKFPQTMGIAIARANAQLKLRHLHHIRSNRCAVPLAAKCHSRWSSWTTPDASPWFSCNDYHQYEEYHKFCHVTDQKEKGRQRTIKATTLTH